MAELHGVALFVLVVMMVLVGVVLMVHDWHMLRTGSDAQAGDVTELEVGVSESKVQGKARIGNGALLLLLGVALCGWALWIYLEYAALALLVFGGGALLRQRMNQYTY